MNVMLRYNDYGSYNADVKIKRFWFSSAACQQLERIFGSVSPKSAFSNNSYIINNSYSTSLGALAPA